MKTCPYCAEQIQDEAIKCRYCGSLLVELPPRPFVAAPAFVTAEDEPLQYTHSGRRYLLGYGRGFFGIWDRQAPGPPVSRYPRTDEGWRAAWLAFSADEQNPIDVGIHAPGQPSSIQRPVPAVWAPTSSRTVSGWWWALPILMGWLGGLIAWLVNKDVDPDRARAMLVTGIVLSAVALVIGLMALSATPS